MINRHEFQLAAKSFRAGRLSLEQFTTSVFAESAESARTPDVASDRHGDPIAVGDWKPQRAGNRFALPNLRHRDNESHKGDYGRVLLIGGSVGMAGAISLSSLAALRCGSGLVKVAVPTTIQPTVAAFSPCYMTIGCPDEFGQFHEVAADRLINESAWADVVAIGPGMGRGIAQQTLVAKIYAEFTQPLIVDADALNALAESRVDLSQHAGPRILTPHAGEFQRLTDVSTHSRDEMEQRAGDCAAQNDVLVVLKGHRTLVTDGRQTYHNQTGNPGMATAGSGDVLTGIITALVGQKFSPMDAAALGVHLHGLAGDIAADQRGQIAMIATDILDSLSVAIKKQLAAGREPIGFGNS